MSGSQATLTSLLDTSRSLELHGLIVERVGADLRANVEHVPCHSPAGFECGYGGSGPADLALAVLHKLIPPPREEDEEALQELDAEAFLKADADPSLWSVTVGPMQTRVSRLAFALHQQFKSEFIARMPREGGFVPIDAIRKFIESETIKLQAEPGN